MADEEELTRDEVFALARAFPSSRSARTLLTMARFPAWAIPENGYANSLEFWSLVAGQIAAGVGKGLRRDILLAAKEWLPGNGEFAAFAAAAGQAASPPPAQPAPAGRLRVLVLGASPIDADLPHVRADREGRAIENTALPGQLAVKIVPGAEATDVRHVGSFRPDILHFVCHGAGDSLVFNDERGEADYVAADRVARRLRFYRDEQGVRLRGIVLAACAGELIAPAFAELADTVIAHRGKLADQCGVAFAEQFYARLSQVAAPSTDLAAIAREAAQLTAQYSAVCDPVVSQLILLPDGR